MISVQPVQLAPVGMPTACERMIRCQERRIVTLCQVNNSAAFGRGSQLNNLATSEQILSYIRQASSDYVFDRICMWGMGVRPSDVSGKSVSVIEFQIPPNFIR